MVIDAHLHCTGRETTSDVLRTLDDAEVEIGVLLAPFLGPAHAMDDAATLRRGNAHLAGLIKGHRDRLVGLCVVDPRDAHAPDDLRHAIEDLGLDGVKMVPTGWYPYDERVQPTFAVAAQLKLPVLFHSGIFIDGRSSRFCRPTYFEVMREHPGLRVALAHLGWPWTDEAIAVGLIDLINGVTPEQSVFRFDLSFGAPEPYRREMLSRALSVLGAGLLQFGSDCFLPCPGGALRERRGWLSAHLQALALPPDDLHRIFCRTAEDWLGRRPSAPPADVVGSLGLGAAPQAGPHAESSAESSADPMPDAQARAHPFVRRTHWRPMCC